MRELQSLDLAKALKLIVEHGALLAQKDARIGRHASILVGGSEREADRGCGRLGELVFSHVTLRGVAQALRGRPRSGPCWLPSGTARGPRPCGRGRRALRPI